MATKFNIGDTVTIKKTGKHVVITDIKHDWKSIYYVTSDSSCFWYKAAQLQKGQNNG